MNTFKYLVWYTRAAATIDIDNLKGLNTVLPSNSRILFLAAAKAETS
jgi:hypothetical protein